MDLGRLSLYSQTINKTEIYFYQATCPYFPHHIAIQLLPLRFPASLSTCNYTATCLAHLEGGSRRRSRNPPVAHLGPRHFSPPPCDELTVSFAHDHHHNYVTRSPGRNLRPSSALYHRVRNTPTLFRHHNQQALDKAINQP